MDNNIIYTPYIYHICWTKTKMHYIGIEYKNNINGIAHPSNIWNSYFTSSKYVKEYRNIHGEPDLIEVRKTFDTSVQSVMYEYKLLTKLDAANNDSFLNKSNGALSTANNKNTVACFHKETGKNIGRVNRAIFEQDDNLVGYGAKVSKEGKEKTLKALSNANKDKVNIIDEYGIERRVSIHEEKYLNGEWQHANTGRKLNLTEEQRAHRSQTRKGKCVCCNIYNTNIPNKMIDMNDPLFNVEWVPLSRGRKMPQKKVKCEHCDREITVQNINRHIAKCEKLKVNK